MFDVLVIGGGHAGCEAAAAAARRGARTGLLTLDESNLGQMSCNPSIGGVGKGHLVRELDVFDGLMARAGDAAALHRRMLNRSKGPAVWGPRVQADRRRYARSIRDQLAAHPVDIVTGEAVRLAISGGRVTGVELADGARIAARAIVIATGTFLNARLFVGEDVRVGGRSGEAAAVPLGDQLREIGLGQGRLKTGTPPRLDGRTIDWARLQPQPSDPERWTLSALDDGHAPPQLACAITRTTERTHDIIRAAEGRSPLYSGAIGGRGPRYCPSIEDKVRRFGDRDGHQIFLEPEGWDDPLVYPNGISTSLPIDVQRDVVRSIPGLERATIVRPGYAVEYEHVDPRRLDPRLAVQGIAGLYLAGQVNGTTGYEEAAGQGLVAGLNAAGEVLEMAPAEFDRATSYLGVMIDDLTLQGVTEPYRMMTARAEYRLSLRADNAVTRLGGQALALGVSDRRRRQIEEHGDRRVRADWSATPEGQADILYAPYLERQRREWAALARERAAAIPAEFDFARVPGLSTEMIERLTAARPASLDQASRVAGITPAALSALSAGLHRQAA